jgi:protocatechuate 3,4-dioxygenase beta subunit
MTRKILLVALFAAVAPAASAQEPEVGRTSVSGVVRDAAGKPIEGADVWLVTSDLYFAASGELVTAKTPADGRFEFAVPKRWLEGTPPWRQELGIVAHREGYSLGAVSIYRESQLPAQPLEIVLPPADSAKLTVTDPDGKPLAGAKVQVALVLGDSIQVGVSASRVRQVAKSWGSEPRTIAGGAVVARMPILAPPAVESLLSATTDAEGRATIAGLAASQLAGVTIEAPGFGRQRLSRSAYGSSALANPLEALQLARAVPITGQLIGEPQDVAGKSLRIIGYGQSGSKQQVSIQVHAETKTDGQGLFSATVCEGALIPLLDWDPASPLRPVPPEQFQVKPGAKNHVEIPLQPAVRAFGYVKDAATGKGLSGARIALLNSSWRALPLATDGDGRYEATLATGSAYVGAVLAPGYLPGPAQRQPLPQTVSTGSPELKPILMRKGAQFAGTVVDDAGQPAAGAWVTATWYGFHPSVQHHDVVEELVKTEADGRFSFSGIDPTSECRLWASREGAFTRGVTVVKGDQAALTLTISPKNAVRLAGRVIAAGGKPASGAKLEVWQRPWMPAGMEAEPQRVALGDKPELVAGDDGRFTSPPLAPMAAYRVSLADPRFEPAHSPWADAASGKELPPANLLARTLGEHLGIVRDSAGKPLTGALVEFRGGLSRVQARTDAAGKFSLKPAPDGPGLLFVAQDGFWFHGQRIESLGEPIEVRLPRHDEPSGQALRAAPSSVPMAERQKLAQQLFDELIQAAASDLTGQTRLRVLMKWAEVNPSAAVEFITKKPSLIAMNNDAVRFAAANTLLSTAPDDALEIIQSMDAGQAGIGHMGALLYVRSAAALPREDRQRKLDLLAEALVKAQAIKEPGFRLISLAQIAEALLDLGEKERGTKLLTENLETAKKLNRASFDAYLRGAFAEELAQVDLESALSLVNEITDYFEKTRHLANIAQEMAGTRPAEAEKILTNYPPPPADSRLIDQKDHYVVRACYRMAPVDLPRALKLVAAMTDPFHQAHARGVMAVALAKTDAAQSRALIRSAFDGLDAAAAKKPDELPISTGNFGNIGGWLVLHAQRIDPELAAEARWRLLRLLPEVPSADIQQRWRHVEALSSAALFLAEIDAPLARELLTRLDGDLQLGVMGGNSRTWLPAWGVVDPAEALRRAGELGEERTRLQGKITLLPALAGTGEVREKLLHYQAGLWRIDVEDLDN